MRHPKTQVQSVGDSANFTPAPIADADLAYLLRLLFAEPAEAVAA